MLNYPANGFGLSGGWKDLIPRILFVPEYLTGRRRPLNFPPRRRLSVQLLFTQS